MGIAVQKFPGPWPLFEHPLEMRMCPLFCVKEQFCSMKMSFKTKVHLTFRYQSFIGTCTKMLTVFAGSIMNCLELGVHQTYSLILSYVAFQYKDCNSHHQVIYRTELSKQLQTHQMTYLRLGRYPKQIPRNSSPNLYIGFDYVMPPYLFSQNVLPY